MEGHVVIINVLHERVQYGLSQIKVVIWLHRIHWEIRSSKKGSTSGSISTTGTALTTASTPPAPNRPGVRTPSQGSPGEESAANYDPRRQFILPRNDWPVVRPVSR